MILFCVNVNVKSRITFSKPTCPLTLSLLGAEDGNGFFAGSGFNSASAETLFDISASDKFSLDFH